MNVIPPSEILNISPNMDVPFILQHTSGINTSVNQFEILQDKYSDTSSSEDGEIKEVSTTNLLDFVSGSQPITIMQKTTSTEEAGTSKAVGIKNKPPVKPVVVTRKASKEILKHVIDKGSLSPQPPPF